MDDSGVASKALRLAVENSHPDVVDYLVDRGVAIDLGLNDYMTLRQAAENGRLDVVHCWVRCGADINFGIDIDTPGFVMDGVSCAGGSEYLLSIATAVYGCTAFSDRLGPLSVKMTGISYQSHATPLFAAASHGHLAVADYLVRHGAKIEGNGDRSPLLAAAENGHIAVADYLARHGAGIEGSGYRRPLFAAADNGHLDVVDYLVLRGAKVDGGPHFRHTPLEAAASNGHVPIADYLARRGAKIDDKIMLLAATRNGHVLVADYLEGRSVKIDGEVVRRPSPMPVRDQGGPKTRLRLLASILKSHQKLMRASIGSSSIDFTLFGEELGTWRSVWKKGMCVMKDFLDGRLPSQLLDIISCLLVADAMRSASPDPEGVCSKEE
jgi:ankyrin repeat protein